jgi:putative two-component system response regulator
MKTQIAEGKDKDLLDLIKRMAYMAEYHEPEAVYHRERVKAYCYILARGLRFSMPDADTFAQASLLHDIGKVGVPGTILYKSGDLTDSEWEIVRRHPIIGSEILKGSVINLLQIGEVIALTHHERWDGSGYPRGLKGEDIPLSGRIFAVADVFDALTTKRAYKPEIDVPDAIELLKNSSAVLFDPKVVDVFAQNFDEIIKARKQNLV